MKDVIERSLERHFRGESSARSTLVPGLVAAAALLVTAAFIPAPASAALPPGSTAPDFTAQASLDGKGFTFFMRKALSKGPVVLYFYPAAFTKGCDLEAHTFATRKAEFTAAGATIIGVSADSIQRLNAFSADPDYCAGKFPVASDPNGQVARAYGLKMSQPRAGVVDVRGDTVKHGFFPRTTFVINRYGRVVTVLSSKTDHLSPVEHVTRSLAIVRQLRESDGH